MSRGQRLQEILKQPQYQPVSLEHEVAVLFAATQGFADDVHVDRISEWESALVRYIESSHPEILKDISEKKIITEENQEKLREAAENFNRSWLE